MKADPDSGMQIIHIANTYKMTTSQQTAKIIEKYFQKDLTKNLSQSALEILSIIAYRQPITRIEIDDIRGVNSSGALQTLIWRGLIKQDGKKMLQVILSCMLQLIIFYNILIIKVWLIYR